MTTAAVYDFRSIDRERRRLRGECLCAPDAFHYGCPVHGPSLREQLNRELARHGYRLVGDDRLWEEEGRPCGWGTAGPSDRLGPVQGKPIVDPRSGE